MRQPGNKNNNNQEEDAALLRQDLRSIRSIYFVLLFFCTSVCALQVAPNKPPLTGEAHHHHSTVILFYHQVYGSVVAERRNCL